MYATPVIYPLTSIIETFKFGMLGAGEFSWAALGSERSNSKKQALTSKHLFCILF